MQVQESAEEKAGRLAQLEAERLILLQTVHFYAHDDGCAGASSLTSAIHTQVETSRKRLHEAERQRDALLPQLRSLTEDLRRVQVSVSACLCVCVY